MNQIKYGQSLFHGDSARYGTDGLLISGDVQQRIALLGSELSADNLTFRVKSDALDDQEAGWTYLYDIYNEKIQTVDGGYYLIATGSVDWRNFTPGSVLDLYNKPNGTIIGRFYLENVKQVSRKTLEFTCTDCIGILMKMSDHKGGLYTGQTFLSIVQEIFAGSNINYSVEGTVRTARIRGRLPRDNRRNNLAKLLIATGATLTEKNGVVIIKYLAATSPQALGPIYLTGNDVSYCDDLATEVQAVEHAFYTFASDRTVTLFDNTGESVAVTNQLIVFDEPCHDLTVTGGLTISENNVNYAIVSGIGTLTGKEYTHTTRVISLSTGVAGRQNVKVIDDNELIGVHNSQNVTLRMAAYYSAEIAAVMDEYDQNGDLLPGTPVSFTDAFGTARTGWIRSKVFALGNKTKAKLDALTGWTPGPFGDSYTKYKVFRASDISSGRINFPSDMVGAQALVMLFGGAQGGQGGYNGQAGTAKTSVADIGVDAPGGYGGNPGQPGERGMVFSVQVQALPAYYTGAAIGAGGNGGAAGGSLGSAGGATTLNGWSSANGSQLMSEHINMIDGTVYARANVSGIAGGRGGYGRGIGEDGQDTSTKGGNVGTAAGGAYGNGSFWRERVSSGQKMYWSGGTGGGGAAYGRAGYPGQSSSSESGSFDSYGGNGATPVAFAQAAETQPGRGGNGGGGGGGSVLQKITYSWNGNVSYGWNHAGTGGAGSAGAKGGDGLILIYYTPAS